MSTSPLTSVVVLVCIWCLVVAFPSSVHHVAAYQVVFSSPLTTDSANGMDGDYATFIDATVASGATITIDYERSISVVAIRYAPRPSFGSRMTGGVFQVCSTLDCSTGGSTFYTISGTPASNTYTTVVVPPTTGRYFRYVSPTNGYLNLAEIQFLEAAYKTLGTTGSWSNAGNIRDKVFDNDVSTYYDALESVGCWVGKDYGKSVTIQSISVYPRSGDTSRMVGGQFQISSVADFSSDVITVHTITTQPTAGTWATYKLTPPVTTQYIRYYGPANGFCNVAEIKFNRINAMVIGAAGEWVPGASVDLAFDGDLSTNSDTPVAQGWLGLSYFSTVSVSQIRYAPRFKWGSRMVGGQFQMSTTADFSSGNTVLATVGSEPTPLEYTTITLSHPVSGRYFRFYGSSDSYSNVAELDFVIVPSQAAALYTIYTETNGAGWINRDGWSTGSATSTDAEVCTWHGVSCSSNNVYAVDLSSNNLVGQLPIFPSGVSLSYLHTLHLSDNSLTGPMTAFVSSLVGMPLLQLWLANNQLNGAIPDLSALDLTVLHLENNQFTGSFPTLSTDIVQLDLTNNKLSGSIPTLSNFALLSRLLISANMFTGTAPSLSINSPEYYDISCNKFDTGMIQNTATIVITDCYNAVGAQCQDCANKLDIVGGISGDPQFSGLQGQHYQVHGAHDVVFNLISSPHFALNGLFTYLASPASACDYNETACWSHPGTYITRVTARLHLHHQQHAQGTDEELSSSQKYEVAISVTARSHSEGPYLEIDQAPIHASKGHVQSIPLGHSMTIDNSKCDHRLNIKQDGSIVLTVCNLMHVHIMNSDAFLNMDVQLLRGDYIQMGQVKQISYSLADDVKLESYYKHVDIPLHGLLGQTWAHIIYANGHVYAGDVMDYAVSSNNANAEAFSIIHKYNLYEPPQHSTVPHVNQDVNV